MNFDYRKHKDKLFFVPLGGTSEIGLNCSLYHFQGKWLMVDLGLGFADKDKIPGVDVLVPDLSFINKYKEDIVGLVLTHAHEDHIGAIQYIADELKCDMYANKFTAAVLRLKLSEAGISDIKIKEFKEGSSFDVGPFNIEPIGLSHSIPEMSSLFIRTSEGNIYHTGDWKLDHNPVEGYVTKENDLKRIASEGVLALVSDSTNIFNNGSSGSEGDLRESLKTIIGDIKQGMVVITTFASNIARIKSIAEAAASSGRRVALLGRSLLRMTQAAKEVGYLQGIDDFVSEDSINSYKRHELVVIATGCQGEENAAIAKLAAQDHRTLKLRKEDTVIFASKIIPGNDKRIFECLNKFAILDIKVMTEEDHFVHVSGHPSREEVRKMYEILKPRFAIPVHGESMHIHEHARFAREIGVKATAIAENGMVINIDSEEVFSLGKIAIGYLAVDGNYLTPTNSRIFHERRIMQNHGILIISVSLDKGGKVKNKPYIIGPGVIDGKADKEVIVLLQNGISNLLKDRKNNDIGQIKTSIFKYVTSTVRDEMSKRPIIEVIVDTSAAANS